MKVCEECGTELKRMGNTSLWHCSKCEEATSSFIEGEDIKITEPDGETPTPGYVKPDRRINEFIEANAGLAKHNADIVEQAISLAAEVHRLKKELAVYKGAAELFALKLYPITARERIRDFTAQAEKELEGEG